MSKRANRVRVWERTRMRYTPRRLPFGVVMLGLGTFAMLLVLVAAAAAR